MEILKEKESGCRFRRFFSVEKDRLCKLNIVNLLCTLATLVQFNFFINYYARELNMLQIKSFKHRIQYTV